MKLGYHIANLFFPPRCALCRKLLHDEETDICRTCRTETVEYPPNQKKYPHLERSCVLWYYEGAVRHSLLLYKFYHQRSHAHVYGRLLAMKLLQSDLEYDILTWVPISRLRKWWRGYDQVELIAQVIGKELEIAPVCTLQKVRNTPPQSRLGDAAKRRANVLNAYRCTDRQVILGKRILLLDDIITTGATASECARTLLTGGAKTVFIGAVAGSSNQRRRSR